MIDTKDFEEEIEAARSAAAAKSKPKRRSGPVSAWGMAKAAVDDTERVLDRIAAATPEGSLRAFNPAELQLCFFRLAIAPWRAVGFFT